MRRAYLDDTTNPVASCGRHVLFASPLTQPGVNIVPSLDGIKDRRTNPQLTISLEQTPPPLKGGGVCDPEGHGCSETDLDPRLGYLGRG